MRRWLFITLVRSVGRLIQCWVADCLATPCPLIYCRWRQQTLLFNMLLVVTLKCCIQHVDPGHFRESFSRPVWAGQAKSFRNHALSRRCKKVSSSKLAVYGHMWAGQRGSVRNKTLRKRGKAKVSEATPFVGGARHCVGARMSYIGLWGWQREHITYHPPRAGQGMEFQPCLGVCGTAKWGGCLTTPREGGSMHVLFWMSIHIRTYAHTQRHPILC